MRRVALTSGDVPRFVYVRELRGDDEESIVDTDTWTAIVLVDRLLVDVPGAAVRPGEARSLSAADRDRILAAIHVGELGPRVASTTTCPGCGGKFDTDFRLDELVASIEPSLDGVEVIGAGRFRLADGTCFRVPTGEDELIASATPEPAVTLRERCVDGGAVDADRLGALLEQVAPVIDVLLDVTCAECGLEHQVRFDVQSFFLGRLLAERRHRTSEIHRLARGYGWALGEILGLPRRSRRSYVELVEREARA